MPRTWTPGQILALRRGLRLSQAALGDRVGTSENAVGNWEKGKYRPSLAHMRALDTMKQELKKLATD